MSSCRRNMCAYLRDGVGGRAGMRKDQINQQFTSRDLSSSVADLITTAIGSIIVIYIYWSIDIFKMFSPLEHPSPWSTKSHRRGKVPDSISFELIELGIVDPVDALCHRRFVQIDLQRCHQLHEISRVETDHVFAY